MMRLINQYFTCPMWHRPLLSIVPEGIEIRCRSCKQVHFIARSHLEQAWNDLESVERPTKPLVAIVVTA
jgi:hypothetical protein